MLSSIRCEYAEKQIIFVYRCSHFMISIVPNSGTRPRTLISRCIPTKTSSGYFASVICTIHWLDVQLCGWWVYPSVCSPDGRSSRRICWHRFYAETDTICERWRGQSENKNIVHLCSKDILRMLYERFQADVPVYTTIWLSKYMNYYSINTCIY